MLEQKSRRPGDIILDRYLPNASVEEREAARENFRCFARLLMRVHKRLAREAGDNATRVNRTGKVDSESLSKSV